MGSGPGHSEHKQVLSTKYSQSAPQSLSFWPLQLLSPHGQMGGETQRDGGELSDIQTQPRSFPAQSALLCLTLLVTLSDPADRQTVHANVLCMTEGSGQKVTGVQYVRPLALQNKLCKWQSSPTVRVKCSDFYKTRGRHRNYGFNLFRGKYSADFIPTMSQGDQGNTIFPPTTNIELLKQNRIPENSPLTAWAQHSPVFKDFTNATNKCDF